MISMYTEKTFYEIPNGTRIFNRGFDQCVALANVFHADLIGVAQAVAEPSASLWWENYDKNPRVNQNYVKIPAGAVPQKGDLFVAKGGAFNSVHGHIGVVTGIIPGEAGVRHAQFTTLEQNGRTNRYVGRDAWFIIEPSILGFLRPKKHIKTAPAGNVKTVDQLADEVWAGKWGTGADRKKLLEAAGHDYSKVQAAVNAKAKVQPKTHKVKKGETLSSIAAQYDTTWQSIHQKNRNIIENPNIIYAGQVFKI